MNGAGPGGAKIMVELEHDERETVLRSLEQRKRSSGVGTPEYDRAKRVIDKLSNAGVIPRPVQSDAREEVARA